MLFAIAVYSMVSYQHLKWRVELRPTVLVRSSNTSSVHSQKRKMYVVFTASQCLLALSLSATQLIPPCVYAAYVCQMAAPIDAPSGHTELKRVKCIFFKKTVKFTFNCFSQLNGVLITCNSTDRCIRICCRHVPTFSSNQCVEWSHGA